MLSAENEEFKKKIEELEAQKSCSNPSGNEQQTEMEKKRAEWEAKEQEMVKMKEQIEFLTGYVDVRNEDYKELKNVIQEMEGTITSMIVSFVTCIELLTCKPTVTLYQIYFLKVRIGSAV